jgi:hypothetical protein
MTRSHPEKGKPHTSTARYGWNHAALEATAGVLIVANAVVWFTAISSFAVSL